jgi:hypothetical protein
LIASMILIGVLLLLVLLLAIPVTLNFRISVAHGVSRDLEVVWGFGLVRYRRVGSLTLRGRSRGRRGKVSPRVAKRSPDAGGRFLALARQRNVRRRLMRYLRDLWRTVRKEDLSLSVRMGLDDPADTGKMWALLGPVSGMLSNVRGVKVDLEPDFSEEVFELEGAGTLRVVPARVIGISIGLLLSRSIWSAIWRPRQR